MYSTQPTADMTTDIEYVCAAITRSFPLGISLSLSLALCVLASVSTRTQNRCAATHVTHVKWVCFEKKHLIVCPPGVIPRH